MLSQDGLDIAAEIDRERRGRWQGLGRGRHRLSMGENTPSRAVERSCGKSLHG